MASPPSPADDATRRPVPVVDPEEEKKFDSSNSSSTVRGEDTASTNDGTIASDPEKPSAVAAASEEPAAAGTKNLLIIVLSLCICAFLAALDQTIITTAIPVIAGEFKSPSAYTWIGSSYMLASAAFLPSWGKFSDIWGRKPVLLSAAVLFMIGSILCAAAQNIGLLLAGRVIQGLGAGGQLGLVNVTIADIVTLRQRGMYLSLLGMTWALASAIGPVLGGVFTGMADWGWRFCFIINIPVGLCAIFGIYMFLHLHSPTITLREGLKRVDWLGTVFIVSGVILFLIALEFGGIQQPWDSAIVICFLVFGILLIIAFIIVEWKFAVLPIMPLRLFTNRTRICCYLVGFTHGFVFIGGCYFLPLFFQAVRGNTPLLSGVYVLPFVITLSLVSGASGIIIAKTGLYQFLIWGGSAMMALGFGLIVMINRRSSWAELVIFQLIAGAGAGPLFQSPLIALHSTINPKDIATATTTFAFVRTLGTALAISLGLVIFQNAMAGQQLDDVLGPELADLITGESASASVDIIGTLHGVQKAAAQDAYAVGMKAMWWFFMAVSLCCVLASTGIGKHHLSKELNSSQPAVKRPKRGYKGGKGDEEA